VLVDQFRLELDDERLLPDLARGRDLVARDGRARLAKRMRDGQADEINLLKHGPGRATATIHTRARPHVNESSGIRSIPYAAGCAASPTSLERG
jgi:hypothetical protein